MVHILFSVSAFVDGGAVAVVGSSPSLGCWDAARARVLYPQTAVRSSILPTTFMNWVDVPEIQLQTGGRQLQLRSNLAYKFLRLRAAPKSGPSPEAALRSDVEASLAAPDLQQAKGAAFDFKQRPHFRLRRDAQVQWVVRDAADLEWEGNGSQDNRFLLATGASASSASGGFAIDIESLDAQPIVDETAVDVGVFLPTADFLEPSGVSECTQTTRYYRTVKSLRSVHFAKVYHNIFVGSCPRQVVHLHLFRDQLGVGCVFNFQAVEDLLDNWINDTDAVPLRTPAKLAEIYLDHDLSLVHVPTVDMSTPARSAMMAQSAILILNYLRSNPKKAVYIHCNAGVGRAVAASLSFLHFVLKMPVREAIAYLKQRRPMAYPDVIALNGGLRDYKSKYAQAAELLLNAP